MAEYDGTNFVSRIDDPKSDPFGMSNIVVIILEIIVLIVGSMGLSLIIYNHHGSDRESFATPLTVISGIIYLLFMILLFSLYSSWRPGQKLYNTSETTIPFMGDMNTILLLIIMCVCFLIYLTTTCLGVIYREPGDLDPQSYGMIVIACIFSFIPLIIMFNSYTIKDEQTYSFLAVFGCAFASLVGAIIILTKPNIITVSTHNVSDYKNNTTDFNQYLYYRIYLLLTGLSVIVIIPLMRMMVVPTKIDDSGSPVRVPNEFSFYILIAIESLIFLFSLYQYMATDGLFSSGYQKALKSSHHLLFCGFLITGLFILVQIYCYRNNMLDTPLYEFSLFGFKMGLILIGIADTVIGYYLF